MNSNAWYVAQAHEIYQDEGTIEIDDNAVVSNDRDPGAYVQAWVWVDNVCGDEPITDK